MREVENENATKNYFLIGNNCVVMVETKLSSFQPLEIEGLILSKMGRELSPIATSEPMNADILKYFYDAINYHHPNLVKKISAYELVEDTVLIDGIPEHRATFDTTKEIASYSPSVGSA